MMEGPTIRRCCAMATPATLIRGSFGIVGEESAVDGCGSHIGQGGVNGRRVSLGGGVAAERGLTDGVLGTSMAQ